MNCPYPTLSAPPEGLSEGPACRVRRSTFDHRFPFTRGLKSRAKSGAKAPHSIWSAAIHRRFSVKALAFTTLPLTVLGRDHESALAGTIHEWPLPFNERLR